MKYSFAYAQGRLMFHDAVLQNFFFEGNALVMDLVQLNASKNIIPEAELRRFI